MTRRGDTVQWLLSGQGTYSGDRHERVRAALELMELQAKGWDITYPRLDEVRERLRSLRILPPGQPQDRVRAAFSQLLDDPDETVVLDIALGDTATYDITFDDDEDDEDEDEEEQTL